MFSRTTVNIESHVIESGVVLQGLFECWCEGEYEYRFTEYEYEYEDDEKALSQNDTVTGLCRTASI